MIGFYNYTVVLTYLSLVSASAGIIVSLSGGGHPYIGVFFLLLCGFCDAFDGKVARTKKDRTDEERAFGIQIDSLSDVVAFGILPACIGVALLRTSSLYARFNEWGIVGRLFEYVAITALILYVLAAMIRLAYFNVTEEIRQSAEEGARKYYTGLPVTSAAIVIPFAVMLRFLFNSLFEFDVTVLYFVFIILMTVAFLGRFQMKKPTTKHILIMIGIGVLEAVAIAILYYVFKFPK